jgi:hypothetical protein
VAFTTLLGTLSRRVRGTKARTDLDRDAKSASNPLQIKILEGTSAYAALAGRRIGAGQHAAAEDQGMAGHERRAIRQHPHNGFGDFVGLSETTEGMESANKFVGLGRAEGSIRFFPPLDYSAITPVPLGYGVGVFEGVSVWSGRLTHLRRENAHMGFLDSVLAPCFRNEQAGRVVVFTWDRRGRGYLVESPAEEQKIRSFLKMHFFAYLSIMLLGYLLASSWSSDLVYMLGRPAHHMARTGITFLGIYLVVVGLPTLLLWKSYKNAMLSFVSPENEVVVSKAVPSKKLIWAGVAIAAMGVLIMVAVFLLVRAR